MLVMFKTHRRRSVKGVMLLCCPHVETKQHTFTVHIMLKMSHYGGHTESATPLIYVCPPFLFSVQQI